MQFGIQQFDFPIVNLKSLVSNPIPENIRLGHQMEFICKQLLDHSLNYEVMVCNLPIREEKRTIGEIDFILKDLHTEQIIHVELTYKFYIIDTTIPKTIHQLIGPNKSDAFFMKMEKIKNKQFSLLHSQPATETLLNKSIDVSKIHHQACFKAQLFKPYLNAHIDIHPLNEKCIVGYWLRLPAFDTNTFVDLTFYLPIKKEWAIEPHTHVDWISHENTLLTIKQQHLNNSSPMVWVKKSESKFEKIFIVWW